MHCPIVERCFAPSHVLDGNWHSWGALAKHERLLKNAEYGRVWTQGVTIVCILRYVSIRHISSDWKKCSQDYLRTASTFSFYGHLPSRLTPSSSGGSPRLSPHISTIFPSLNDNTQDKFEQIAKELPRVNGNGCELRVKDLCFTVQRPKSSTDEPTVGDNIMGTLKCLACLPVIERLIKGQVGNWSITPVPLEENAVKRIPFAFVLMASLCVFWHLGLRQVLALFHWGSADSGVVHTRLQQPLFKKLVPH